MPGLSVHIQVVCTCLVLAFIPLSARAREITRTSKVLQNKASRYTQPWRSVPRWKLPTLKESNYRAVRSAFRRGGGEGIGHQMATKNAEIVTALRLGVSYFHRAPLFSSLTENAPDLMEDFFGWNQREISDDSFFHDHCKESEGDGLSVTQCRPCTLRSGNMTMKHLVQVPPEFSFSRDHNTLQLRIREFKRAYPETGTVFEMEASTCGSSPTFSDFSKTSSWYYWKYWNHHSVALHDTKSQQEYLHGREVLRALNISNPKLSKDLTHSSGARTANIRDNPLNMNDHEFTIAVHVRRGDFFVDKKRKMLKSVVYARLVRTIQDVVEEVGGKFGSLPVAVYIFSEGRPLSGTFETHVQKKLSKQYIDEYGVVRSARWWAQLVSSQTPQGAGRPRARRAKQVKAPRVELRVNEPTVQTMHQMIRADIFIGSVSGLSNNVVRSLARGIGIYPSLQGHKILPDGCCAIGSDTEIGVINRTSLVEAVKMYRIANEHFL